MAQFPLPSALFPEVKLSSPQTADFFGAREQLLASTMGARDQFRRRMRSRMNPAQWKVVKRRRHVADMLHSSKDASRFTIYRPRSGSHIPRPCEAGTCSPLLVGVGTVDGTLDDIALGLTSTTTQGHRSGAAVLHSDVVDSRVLSTLETPTPDSPFEYLGFKWMARAPVPMFKSFVRPRDYMYLEATGFRTDPTTGERTFHLLVHSVTINCYRSFENDYGIVRGTMSFGFLFSEGEANGRVDVFCKGYVDPSGSAMEQVAISSAVDAMIGYCEKAWRAGASKKLGWLVQERCRREEQGDINVDTHERCVGCRASSSSGLETCDACGRSVCAPCRQQAPVIFPATSTSAVLSRHGNQLNGQTRLNVCEHCALYARRVDASRVAYEEAVEAVRAMRQHAFSVNSNGCRGDSGERTKLAPLKKRSLSSAACRGIIV